MRKDVRESWIQLATDLGFEFKPCLEALQESPSLRMMGEALGRKEMSDPRHLDRALAMLANPMFRAVLEKMILGVVTGHYRGCEFMLMRGARGGGGSGRTSYNVNIGLLFRTGLGVGLVLKRRSLFTGLGHLLRRGGYVRFPDDPPFDRLVSATADDPLEAAAYLASPETHEAVSRLQAMDVEYTISDHGVRIRKPGHTITRDEALPYMDAMVRVAECF